MTTHLGAMLRLYRTVRERTLRELGPEIGVSAATLLRIETGRVFSAASLVKLGIWLLKPDPNGPHRNGTNRTNSSSK